MDRKNWSVAIRLLCRLQPENAAGSSPGGGIYLPPVGMSRYDGCRSWNEGHSPFDLDRLCFKYVHHPEIHLARLVFPSAAYPFNYRADAKAWRPQPVFNQVSTLLSSAASSVPSVPANDLRILLGTLLPLAPLVQATLPCSPPAPCYP
jgi:hypothetical protein